MKKLNLGKKNVVPDSITQTYVIMKYSFLDYIRSRRFFVLLLIALIIGGLLTGIVGYFRPQLFLSDVLSFYSGWWGNSITFLIILSAIFFGGDAISGEFQNKTGYFIAGNPIGRSSLYIGKYLAALIGSLIILMLFAVMTLANAAYYFGGSALPYQFVQSLLLSLLYLLSALGLTFFFSSLFKSSAMSIITTVILLLFVFSLLQTLVATLAGIQPFFVLTYGAGVITHVLSAQYPPTVTHVQVSPNFSETAYNASLLDGIIIMVVYFAVTSVLGLILFERKEFN